MRRVFCLIVVVTAFCAAFSIPAVTQESVSAEAVKAEFLQAAVTARTMTALAPIPPAP